MPTNVLERIYKLLAKINMGILDRRFDPERFAYFLQDFLGENGKEKVDSMPIVYERIYKLLAEINTGILDRRVSPEVFAYFLQDFLENKGQKIGKSVSLSQAIEILGRGKVFTAEQSAKAMGMKTPKDAHIRYSLKTIMECDDENKRHVADWRWIHCFGLSLRQLRKKFGADKAKQPCFDKDSAWCLKSKEDGWATQNPQAGYYLINFCGRFSNQNWYARANEIARIGNIEHCHEAIFIEAIFTIFKVNGERIARTWCHWGVSRPSCEESYHVYVGYFSSDGINIGDRFCSTSSDNLRVCVFRKFDR